MMDKEVRDMVVSFAILGMMVLILIIGTVFGG